MAGGVVEGPVQVDLVVGTGDAQRAGVVAAECDEQRALPGRPCSGEQRKQTHEGGKKKETESVFLRQLWEKWRTPRTPTSESLRKRGSLLRGASATGKAPNVLPP